MPMQDSFSHCRVQDALLSPSSFTRLSKNDSYNGGGGGGDDCDSVGNHEKSGHHGNHTTEKIYGDAASRVRTLPMAQKPQSMEKKVGVAQRDGQIIPGERNNDILGRKWVNHDKLGSACEGVQGPASYSSLVLNQIDTTNSKAGDLELSNHSDTDYNRSPGVADRVAPATSSCGKDDNSCGLSGIQEDLEVILALQTQRLRAAEKVATIVSTAPRPDSSVGLRHGYQKRNQTCLKGGRRSCFDVSKVNRMDKQQPAAVEFVASPSRALRSPGQGGGAGDSHGPKDTPRMRWTNPLPGQRHGEPRSDTAQLAKAPLPKHSDANSEDFFLAQVWHQQRQHREVLRRRAEQYPEWSLDDVRLTKLFGAPADGLNLTRPTHGCDSSTESASGPNVRKGDGGKGGAGAHDGPRRKRGTFVSLTRPSADPTGVPSWPPSTRPPAHPPTPQPARWIAAKAARGVGDEIRPEAPPPNQGEAGVDREVAEALGGSRDGVPAPVESAGAAAKLLPAPRTAAGVKTPSPVEPFADVLYKDNRRGAVDARVAPPPRWVAPDASSSLMPELGTVTPHSMRTHSGQQAAPAHRLDLTAAPRDREGGGNDEDEDKDKDEGAGAGRGAPRRAHPVLLPLAGDRRGAVRHGRPGSPRASRGVGVGGGLGLGDTPPWRHRGPPWKGRAKRHKPHLNGVTKGTRGAAGNIAPIAEIPVAWRGKAADSAVGSYSKGSNTPRRSRAGALVPAEYKRLQEKKAQTRAKVLETFLPSIIANGLVGAALAYMLFTTHNRKSKQPRGF